MIQPKKVIHHYDQASIIALLTQALERSRKGDGKAVRVGNITLSHDSTLDPTDPGAGVTASVEILEDNADV